MNRTSRRLLVAVATVVALVAVVWTATRSSSDAEPDVAGPPTTASPPTSSPATTASTTSSTSTTTTTIAAPPTTARPTSGPDGFPDGSTTGVLTEDDLEPSPSIVVDRSGTVIENLDVKGKITVLVEDVIIRNTRISTNEDFGIFVDEELDDVVIEDVTIVGTGPGCTAGLAPFGHWVARRLDVSGCADGVKMHGGQYLEHSYIHDLRVGDETHNDAVQVTSGHDSAIHHNTLIAPSQNAAIMMSSNFASVGNWTITDNKLSGGAYTVYVRNQGYGDPTAVVFRGNTWVAGSWLFGPYSIDGNGVTFEANAGI